ncbi:MAG: hypothetical protein ACRD3Q_04360, partial [Terriglobales bacterium]
MIEDVNLRECNGIADLAAQYRQFFPVTRRYVYLNHASVSPLSTPVHDAMVKMLDGVSRHADRKYEEWE